MTHEEAIEKAVKLLRLAQSDNPHEAALAAAMAQKIIERHKLVGVSADINIESNDEPDEDIKNFEEPLSMDSKQSCTYKMRLAMGIASLNQVKLYTSHTMVATKMRKVLMMVGRPSGVQTVRYMYDYLHREVNRISGQAEKGFTLTWGNNFRLGMVDTIVDRMRQMREEVRKEVMGEARSDCAIVRVNNAIAKMYKAERDVAAWMDQNLRLGRGRSVRERGNSDHGARAAGVEAGRRVNLNSGKPLGSGQTRLTGGMK